MNEYIEIVIYNLKLSGQFLIFTAIIFLPMYLIYRAIKKANNKRKYEREYNRQLLEEQNELLRKMVEDKVKD